MYKLATIAPTGKLTTIILTLVFFIGVNLTSSAQSNPLENQTKVAEYLGDSRFNDLLVSNPSYLEFLDTRCSKGYAIIDMPIEKTEGLDVLTSVSFEDWVPSEKPEETIFSRQIYTQTIEEFIASSSSSEFNFLKYDIKFDRTEVKYYVLGTSGKTLMVYPVEYINKQLTSTN